MTEVETMRPSFAFYWSFKDAINDIPNDKEKLEIYEAITDFAFLGKEPELSPFGKAMWKLIKPNLISSMARFDRCVANGKKGAEHGRKGGRPRKQKTQEKPQEKPHNVDVDVDVDVDVEIPKFNKLNCGCEDAHTLTQEEEKEYTLRYEEAINRAKEFDGKDSKAYQEAIDEAKAVKNEYNAKRTYNPFMNFLETQCPELQTTMNTLTIDQYGYWYKTAGAEWIKEVCQKMNGRKDTKEKYDDLHSALTSWWDKDYNNPKNK